MKKYPYFVYGGIFIIKKDKMARYLKSFGMDSERLTYEDSENYIEPYVSYVDENDSVHYNKVETKLVVYYDIQDISAPTTIWTNYDGGVVKSIEVDGTLLDSSLTTTYQFDSVGEHIIKYEFHNPTIVGNSAPLFYNLTTVKRVVISNTFTAIGNNAFLQCKDLTSVTIGNSVTSIGAQAFNYCSGLTSVIIPNSVTNIGAQAFYYCSGLTSVTVPDSVTTIGDSAFENCSGLTSVTIGNGVTNVGQYAFRYCNNLITVMIGDSVTSIGRQAFYGNPNLTSITLKAITPPTLVYQSLDYTNDCPIYVPSASVETYKAASGWSTYASRIQAIPQT